MTWESVLRASAFRDSGFVQVWYGKGHRNATTEHSVCWAGPVQSLCARNRVVGMALLFYSFVLYEQPTVAGQKFSEK